MFNRYEGLASSQPLFLRLLHLATIGCIALHTVVVLVSWVIAVLHRTLFVNPLAADLWPYPAYWGITNTCLAIAAMLILPFILLSIVAGLTWFYCVVTRSHPVPRTRPELTVSRISPVYITLAAYGIVFFMCTLVGNVKFLSDAMSLLSSDAPGVVVGMVLVTPFILALCVGFVVLVFWFCVALIPCALLSGRMLDYVSRPIVSNAVGEGELHEEG